MYITGKLVRLLFEAAENVHEVIDDAGGVAVADAGQVARRLRPAPLVRLCVEAKEDIAA